MKKLLKISLLKYSLTLLATTLLVASTNRTAVGFTINFAPPDKSNPYLEYEQNGFKGYTSLVVPKEVPQGGTEETDLLNLLNDFSDQHGGGWSFGFANDNLQGSFDFNYYDACVPGTGCSPEINLFPPTNGVGASIGLTYNPIDNDPKPGISDIFSPSLHWIQRVRSNHPGGSTLHGVDENVLDISSGSNTPFYADLRNNTDFTDAPYRTDPFENHDWNAELYLAKETAPKTVTIYNGIEWGWKNRIVRRGCNPVPAPIPVPIPDTVPAPIPDIIPDLIPAPMIDLEFLFDTTGSMGGHIQGVQAAATNILNRLDASGADYCISVADYKDFPEQSGYPYRPDLPFSNDKTAIINSIDSLSSNIGGGGDTPEAAYSGLIRAMQTEGLGSWRNGAKKAVVIMTDAPPHDPEPHTGYTLKDVVDEAYAVDPASIYSIIPGGDPTAVSYFSQISSSTGGKLYTTNSSDDIANALLDITNQVTTSPSNPGGTVQSVPEPSPIKGLLTLIPALLGLSLLKRKKRVKDSIIHCLK